MFTYFIIIPWSSSSTRLLCLHEAPTNDSSVSQYRALPVGFLTYKWDVSICTNELFLFSTSDRSSSASRLYIQVICLRKPS